MTYAVAATLGGLKVIAQGDEALAYASAAGVLALAHGRVIAAYIVHECAHSSVFFERKLNAALGIAMLWIGGCPYIDFDHVKRLHVAHHIDRADTISFDYKAELKALPSPILKAILALEYCFVPIVEMLMHLRTALYPLVALRDPKIPSSRRVTAAVGTTAILALWGYLFSRGGLYAVALNAAATALLLHILSAHDAFQHTYIVLTGEDPSGPGSRTAQYEEDNTFSNLISKDYPLLNLLSLNFGYHNAHHSKPMAAWYKLPAIHDALYASDGGSPQVLPMSELVGTWVTNRVARAIDESYGTVGSGPNRADTFIGSLGVSFLTV